MYPLISPFIIYSILFLSLVLVVLFIKSHRSLKENSIQNIIHLSKEIQSEEQRLQQLNHKVQSVKKKEYSIHNNLTDIQLNIVQIEFSYKEVIYQLTGN